ncbi:MAG: nuclear transport factor 2 family protein [Dermatophilaceae bacterium]
MTIRDWHTSLPGVIATGYAAVDHRTPEVSMALVTDDFQLTTFTLGGEPVGKDAWIEAMERRRTSPAETRHLVNNLRALEEAEHEVRLGYVLTVHRLEADAEKARAHVTDVEDTWRRVDDEWRLARRTLTLAFPRLYSGVF